jgi:hypothetical protein
MFAANYNFDQVFAVSADLLHFRQGIAWNDKTASCIVSPINTFFRSARRLPSQRQRQLLVFDFEQGAGINRLLSLSMSAKIGLSE